MIVRGLIQRDPAGRLWPTKEGRTVHTALLAKARHQFAAMQQTASEMGHERTHAPQQTTLGSITKSAASHDMARSPASLAGIGCRWSGREDDRCGGAT
jgi:hypothetical protein